MYVPTFKRVWDTNCQKFLNLMTAEGVPELLVSDIMSLVADTDYFEAPASTRYHGAYPGGLFDHSLAMTQALKDFTNRLNLVWEREFSPVVVGMLHDFTKVGKYSALIQEFDAEDDEVIPPPKLVNYEYNVNALSYGGHGSDSLIKILQKVPLSDEESLCIRFHMGAYEKEAWEEFDHAIRAYQTVLWTHHADMIASKVVGV